VRLLGDTANAPSRVPGSTDRDARHAGPHPKRIPVAIASSVVNRRTVKDTREQHAKEFHG
jgi:hypothetical protein